MGNDKAKTVDPLAAEIAKLRAENERLKVEAADAKAKAQAAMSIAVSSKGGVSVYGLGRFPVSLYEEQWERLAAKMPEILAFVREGKALGALKAKGAETFVQPNGLPLKFVAKVATEAPAKGERRTSAL